MESQFAFGGKGMKTHDFGIPEISIRIFEERFNVPDLTVLMGGFHFEFGVKVITRQTAMESLTSSSLNEVSVRARLGVVEFPVLPGDRLQTGLTDRPPAVLAGGAIAGMRVEGDVVFLVED